MRVLGSRRVELLPCLVAECGLMARNVNVVLDGDAGSVKRAQLGRVEVTAGRHNDSLVGASIWGVEGFEFSGLIKRWLECTHESGIVIAVHSPRLPCLAPGRDVGARRYGLFVSNEGVALRLPRVELLLRTALQLGLIAAGPVEDDIAAEFRLENIILVEDVGAEVMQTGLGHILARLDHVDNGEYDFIACRKAEKVLGH